MQLTVREGKCATCQSMSVSYILLVVVVEEVEVDVATLVEAAALAKCDRLPVGASVNPILPNKFDSDPVFFNCSKSGGG